MSPLNPGVVETPAPEAFRSGLTLALPLPSHAALGLPLTPRDCGPRSSQVSHWKGTPPSSEGTPRPCCCTLATATPGPASLDVQRAALSIPPTDPAYSSTQVLCTCPARTAVHISVHFVSPLLGGPRRLSKPWERWPCLIPPVTAIRTTRFSAIYSPSQPEPPGAGQVRGRIHRQPAHSGARGRVLDE